MKESLHVKAAALSVCCLGGLMAALFGLKQKTFLQCKRDKPAGINGRFNEHISQWETMVGFGHTTISSIKIHYKLHTGLSHLQAAEKH